MEYVSGGTLSEFVKEQDPANPPSIETMMRILTGSAKGLAYLHAIEPMPILHRDIKTENILLTDQLEPRIADLGEARTMAKDQAMTIVSLFLSVVHSKMLVSSIWLCKGHLLTPSDSTRDTGRHQRLHSPGNP